jgi:hypothetical protein
MKKLLAVMLFALMCSGMHSQTTASKILLNPELNKILILKDLASKIRTAETELVSTSRSNVPAAQSKVNSLYAAYAKELENQKTINSKNNELIKAINEELIIVNSKK